MKDPFADDNPWDVPTDNTPATEEKPLSVAQDDEAYTITLKYGGGYDAPWIVVRAADAEAAKSRLLEAQQEGLLEMIAKASNHVATLVGDKPAAAPQRKSRPAPAQAAPEDGDDCPHGRKLVDKGSWAAKFCSAPKGEQCEPLWRQRDGSFKSGK